ncbi:hypothetical protein Ndes2526B_g08835 [Nannochloris sp. 'desiccata']
MTIAKRPPVSCLLIDLDDTLYQCPEMSGLVSDKIREYMVNKLKIPVEEVQEKCSELYLNFGTTLAGLVASGYTVDFDDWHAEVHGTLPYEKYLRPDPKMKILLDSIPVPKFIFTNADLKHAEICLDLMGLRSCFQGIICFESIMKAAEQNGMVHHNKPVICKPNRQAFELALKEANGAEIATTAFFDDSTRNITSAHRIGIFSVLIGRVGVECASDVQMRSMHELKEHLPWLVEIGDGCPGDDGPVAASPCLAKNEAAEELLEEAHLTALSVRA